MFDEENEHNAKINKPHYECIKVDLSGKKKEKVYLWYLFGTGKWVFTGLTIKRAPSLRKNEGANKSRLYGMRLAGITVCGHPKLDMEFHGFSAVVAGQSGPAIDKVMVVKNEADEKKALAGNLTKINANLKNYKLGKKVSIWVHYKKFLENPIRNRVANKFLASKDWFDERVEKCIANYGLSIENVMDIHEVFQILDVAREGKIDIMEVFSYLDEVPARYGVWFLTIIEARDDRAMSFPEYLNICCVFGVMSRLEIIRFIFGILDPNKTSYILEDDFVEMAEILMENETITDMNFQMIRVKKLFPKYVKKNLEGKEEMFFEGFLDLMTGYMPLPYPIYRFVDKLRERNIGMKFWERKMKEFVAARKRLNVRRI